jgi:hypothetical protein
MPRAACGALGWSSNVVNEAPPPKRGLCIFAVEEPSIDRRSDRDRRVFLTVTKSTDEEIRFYLRDDACENLSREVR